MPEQTLVTEVMTTDVVTLRPDQSPAEVADVFAEHGIGAAPVVDDAGNVIGLLRDEDLLVTEARLHVPTTIAILPGVEGRRRRPLPTSWNATTRRCVPTRRSRTSRR